MTSFSFQDYYPVSVQIDTPSNSQADITLVVLPAVGVPIRKYAELIKSLTRAGYHVISADYPCCGANTPTMSRAIDYGYSDIIEDFIPKLLEYVTTDKFALLGHSLGGHLAALYATKYPIPVVGVATGNIHYKHWTTLKGQARLIALVGIIKTMLKLYGYFPGYKIGFGDNEAKTMMQNWCHTALTGRFDFMQEEVVPASSTGLYLNIRDDDFAPYQSTKSLADLHKESILITIDLPDMLQGNPHGAWLKDPTTVIAALDAHLTNILN